jgi:hypothetical protein
MKDLEKKKPSPLDEPKVMGVASRGDSMAALESDQDQPQADSGPPDIMIDK